MDKKDLEKGTEQANKILNSKNKDEILNTIQKNNNDNIHKQEVINE